MRLSPAMLAIALALPSLPCCGAPPGPAQPVLAARRPPSTEVAVPECGPGFADCDGAASNGCETRLDITAEHCGACGARCSPDEQCRRGACRPGAGRLSLGSSHGCAIGESGAVSCWGRGRRGTTMRGPEQTDAADASGPVGGLDQVTQLTAGQNATCALERSGKVLCWGMSAFVHSSKSTQPVPTEVAGLEQVAHIALGDNHGCAAVRSGQVLCWGGNLLGERGAPPGKEPLEPSTIEGVTEAIEVAAGFGFSCALRRSGAVLCWGYHGARLGRGEAPDSAVAARVVGVEDAVEISAGRVHACALRRGGRVVCWGQNELGQLGDGTTTERSAAVPVAGLDDAVQISAGRNHVCALRRTGEAVCWGADESGEAGHGAREPFRTAPVAVLGLEKVTQVAAGSDFSCARGAAGNLSCWGSGAEGRLGDSLRGEYAELVGVPGVSEAAEVAVGDGYSCARQRTGAVMCWGLGANSGGAGHGRERGVPAAAVPGITDAVRLMGGRHRACALRKTGDIACFHGGLLPFVDGSPENVPELPESEGGVGNVQSVAVDTTRLLAVRAGAAGFLRDSSGAASPWVPIAGLGSVKEVAGYDDRGCALKTTGEVVCFTTGEGGGPAGGAGAKVHSVRIEGLRDATSLASGVLGPCALRKKGPPACFYAPGALAPGSKSVRVSLESDLAIDGATQVTTAWNFHCAVVRGGRVMCWHSGTGVGEAGTGELETGGQGSSPTTMRGLSDAVQVATSGSHSCVVHASGKVSCAGSNERDQIGQSEPAWSAAPVALEMH